MFFYFFQKYSLYSYTVGIGCPYHDKIDKPRFCSMSCVKRWAFLIMDQCCPHLGITQEPDTHRHVERPPWDQQKPKYSEQFYVSLGPSVDDTPIPVTAEPDKDLFGAPKTRAAPAGFCGVDLDKVIPNPKKMSKRDREELEVKVFLFRKTPQGLFKKVLQLFKLISGNYLKIKPVFFIRCI